MTAQPAIENLLNDHGIELPPDVELPENINNVDELLAYLKLAHEDPTLSVAIEQIDDMQDIINEGLLMRMIEDEPDED